MATEICGGEVPDENKRPGIGRITLLELLALLGIALVFLVFFFFANYVGHAEPVLKEKCSLDPYLSCMGFRVTSEDVTLMLKNTAGVQMEVQSMEIKERSGIPRLFCKFGQFSLHSSEKQKIKAPECPFNFTSTWPKNGRLPLGLKFKFDVTYTYILAGTGIVGNGTGEILAAIS